MLTFETLILQPAGVTLSYGVKRETACTSTSQMVETPLCLSTLLTPTGLLQVLNDFPGDFRNLRSSQALTNASLHSSLFLTFLFGPFLWVLKKIPPTQGHSVEDSLCDYLRAIPKSHELEGLHCWKCQSNFTCSCKSKQWFSKFPGQCSPAGLNDFVWEGRKPIFLETFFTICSETAVITDRWIFRPGVVQYIVDTAGSNGHSWHWEPLTGHHTFWGLSPLHLLLILSFSLSFPNPISSFNLPQTPSILATSCSSFWDSLQKFIILT